MNKIRKGVAIILSVAALGTMGTACYANNNMDTGETYVTPRYVAIAETSTYCEWYSSSQVECSAATEVWNGYAAGIKAELQIYDGSWTTIKTWTDSDWDYASIYATYYVDNDYEYRLKTTHYSYDSNWNQLESVVKYSDII